MECEIFHGFLVFVKVQMFPISLQKILKIYIWSIYICVIQIYCGMKAKQTRESALVSADVMYSI